MASCNSYHAMIRCCFKLHQRIGCLKVSSSDALVVVSGSREGHAATWDLLWQPWSRGHDAAKH